jgi:hypothetical protein
MRAEVADIGRRMPVDGVERYERAGNNDAPYVLIPLGLMLVLASPLMFLFFNSPLAGLSTLVAASLSLRFGVQAARKHRRALPRSAPHDKERELLSAIRDGGSITPVEVAMETSLTVREADAMLSELANDGHLLVGSEGGALRYSLPSRRHVEEIG